MGLTFSRETETESPGFDDEAWPLLHELIPDGPTIMGKTGQKEIEDALEALNKAAFGP
ncbi:hypothetical protein [Paracoccus aerius]|uniref:Uncharacterized protein n=1 Tax=Paracoccus aerius TaxID=1915382 RepID=A0ABS1S5U6_9RHOB|nr:hypothetical protein [Paracoccus aerius]MBL3674088.1 hypothetical protein [Paracoccus aerius]GHG24115.1 hypothetical protein GCM10017322_22700 [Paracoccus aerius]